MPFTETTIIVNGHEVTLDVDVDLQIAALSGDMKRVAAQMGYWGSVWAAAVKERVEADSFYRHWRAKAGENILASDPKLAEWKVKQKIESSTDFLKYKKALALAEQNVVFAKAAFDSLDKKANQLQSKGAMHRSEIDATDMHTPIVPKKKSKKGTVEVKNMPDSEDPRISAMRNIFNKKK